MPCVCDFEGTRAHQPRAPSPSFSSNTGKHALSYELGWRRLSDPSGRASRSTIGQLGDQIKSAVKYSFAHSAMDNPTFPRNGEL